MGISTSKLKLSVVIPVYGSVTILPELIRQLYDALTTKLQLEDKFEIILVNDCGPDDSWVVIQTLAENRIYLKAINLRKNVGQHNAIMAGLNFATGDVIVTIDDDLQHSPYDIFFLYQKIIEGYDVCYTKFQNRHHSKWKLIGSAFNDLIARYLLKKPKGLYLSPFRAINREIRDELIKYHGPHVYLDGLILTVTTNITAVEVTHYPRHDGKSGYGFRRSVSLWLKMATNFSIAPLRFASLLGMGFSILGLLSAIYLVLLRFLIDQVPAGWTSLIVIILIMGGVQLLALGAIGEYLGRVFLSINNRPQFLVASTLNLDTSPK